MQIKQLEVSNFNVFCYIVGCEKTGEALIIDPAAEAEQILATAKQMGMNHITHIVLTHGHIDHTMGSGEMKRLTGAPIVIHEEDKQTMFQIPSFLLRMMGGVKPPPPDQTVREGDIIEAGETVRLKVIHTPGHSPGGMCLYSPGYVFTGDTLFVQGIGRTDFPGCSFRLLERSIRNKLYTLPDDTVVFPGHNYSYKPSSTIGEEKRSNPFVPG